MRLVYYCTSREKMHHVGIYYEYLPSQKLKWLTACNMNVYDTDKINIDLAKQGAHPIGITEFYSFQNSESARKDFLIPEWSYEIKVLGVDCSNCNSYLQMKLLAHTQL